MTPRDVAALSDILEPLSGGSSACPRRLPWRERKAGQAFRQRLGRAGERKPWRVIDALPPGTVRSSSQKAWLDAVAAAPALAALRADALANVRQVAQQLAWRADWTTMTTRPTWPVLTSQTGLSRATIGRVLLRLRRAGLLGVVASGRSAGCQTVESLHGQGDAAVYVLAVPSPLQAVAPVDESETPSAPLPVVDEPMRARETANDSSEPLRGPHPWPADAGAVQLELADRTVVRLPGRSTRALRLERRKAQAGQVASRVPILATLSTSYVAAILRDFALAGWTTSDLVEAIDWRPDGTRWPHTAATGIDPDPRRGAAAHWLEHRLAAWRDEAGDPMTAPAARRLAAARARIAAQLQARADDDAAAERRPPVQDSAGFAAFKAARAALTRRAPR
ncbi:MAG: hypothetical protein BGO37_10855 [Cellulomonas sp. 73-92]|nr:MAG: hypothetical protein BGO37_10855 [Cellulomonas sp. 73-92]